MQLDGANSILEVTQDARAPIFYDLDNTGYYTNPARNASMYRLELNTDIEMRAKTSTRDEAEVITDTKGGNRK